jgi:50S ribosomal subunit-associated GTPase HflX
MGKKVEYNMQKDKEKGKRQEKRGIIGLRGGGEYDYYFNTVRPKKDIFKLYMRTGKT